MLKQVSCIIDNLILSLALKSCDVTLPARFNTTSFRVVLHPAQDYWMIKVLQTMNLCIMLQMVKKTRACHTQELKFIC